MVAANSPNPNRTLISQRKAIEEGRLKQQRLEGIQRMQVAEAASAALMALPGGDIMRKQEPELQMETIQDKKKHSLPGDTTVAETDITGPEIGGRGSFGSTISGEADSAITGGEDRRQGGG
jgi:hypothetical protein